MDAWNGETPVAQESKEFWAYSTQSRYLLQAMGCQAARDWFILSIWPLDWEKRLTLAPRAAQNDLPTMEVNCLEKQSTTVRTRVFPSEEERPITKSSAM